MAEQNLYQLIGVSETATLKEIEEAAVREYNKARNLVSHYSPEIANKATQALNNIERARTVLLDPAKKAEYDHSLTKTGSVGGLADPAQILGKFASMGTAAVPQSMTRQPVQAAPVVQQHAVDQLVALNAWVCTKCQTPNPKGTKYCKNCGNALGIKCPNCGFLIEASAKKCTECGVDLNQVIKQSEMEIESKNVQITENMRIQPVLVEMQKQTRSALSFSSFWWIIVAWIGLIVWIVGYRKAVNVLNMPDIDSPLALNYKTDALKARSRTKMNMIIFAILFVLFLIISIASNN